VAELYFIFAKILLESTRQKRADQIVCRYIFLTKIVSVGDIAL